MTKMNAISIKVCKVLCLVVSLLILRNKYEEYETEYENNK
jgi:hypothetical protein